MMVRMTPDPFHGTLSGTLRQPVQPINELPESTRVLPMIRDNQPREGERGRVIVFLCQRFPLNDDSIGSEIVKSGPDFLKLFPSQRAAHPDDQGFFHKTVRVEIPIEVLDFVGRSLGIVENFQQ